MGRRTQVDVNVLANEIASLEQQYIALKQQQANLELQYSFAQSNEKANPSNPYFRLATVRVNNQIIKVQKEMIRIAKKQVSLKKKYNAELTRLFGEKENKLQSLRQQNADLQSQVNQYYN